MQLPELSIWLLVLAVIIHTISEAWLPEYEKVKPDWRSVVFNRLLWLDNLPIFIAAIVAGLVGWRWPIVGGILPAVGVTHPLFDHLGLSLKAGKLRPGSWTGLFLFWPAGIFVYAIAYTHQLASISELIISGTIGLAISIWLLWSVIQMPQVQK
jgi:hypothetical protein